MVGDKIIGGITRGEWIIKLVSSTRVCCVHDVRSRQRPHHNIWDINFFCIHYDCDNGAYIGAAWVYLSWCCYVKLYIYCIESIKLNKTTWTSSAKLWRKRDPIIARASLRHSVSADWITNWTWGSKLVEFNHRLRSTRSQKWIIRCRTWWRHCDNRGTVNSKLTFIWPKLCCSDVDWDLDIKFIELWLVSIYQT